MTPRRFLALLNQTPLMEFYPTSYKPYYAVLAAVSGFNESHIRSLNSVDTALPSSILACCPECLATDDVPYIRASWHWPTTFVCPVHRSLISTVCHVCGQLRILAPFKLGATFTPQALRSCLHPNCHSRVEESASGHLPEDHPALWLQDELHHPDLAGLTFIRDGRGLQRSLLSWLFLARAAFGTYGWPLPFDSRQGLVPHWRGSTSWVTDSALTLAQLLYHPAALDDLILTQLIREISSKIVFSVRRVSKKQQEEHFQHYRRSATNLGAVCALFLAWSEVPVLTTETLMTADLERSLRPFLNGTALDFQKVLLVCEDGRRHVLHRLNAGV